MRSGFFGVVLAIGLGTAVAAQDAPSQTIEGVIQSQLNALMADDFATAFTFASPTIKRLFGSSERFGQMVRQGYPMVWRPGEVSYLELREFGSARIQRVLIVDQAGIPHLLDYQMIKTENGWQINGVQLLQAPQVGA